MNSIPSRLTALEKSTGFDIGSPGTVEYHMPDGSLDPKVLPCDKRDDPEHGPNCVYSIAMRTHDGVRFMRIVGFDPAGLD